MKCPNCNAKINEKALVKNFMWEPTWDFWGKKGQRWIVCKEEHYVHFRIDIKGRTRHRLAQITKKI